MPLTTL
ncbi:hypothetical protein YPPY19_3516, partial [Yersinia pestis PY-19]